MTTTHITTLRTALETAYINGATASSLAYRPQFVSNNHKEGKKVLSSVEDELLACDQFQISVAFITMSGITPLLQTLKELEKKNIPGEILTTNYLNFSEPRALKKLNELQNITLKMYDVEAAKEGFHTKGYIFKKEEIYRIIIGSSNITSAALTYNREWNTKIVSTEDGEMAREIVQEFDSLWNSKYALEFDTFYESYREKYKIIKHQRDVAKLDDITSIEKYKLEPNSMQVGFIKNLRKIQEAGERKALLISATGTGKTYASAFAMRELGFQRVLFLVHRNQIAKQAQKSFRKVFSGQVSMGLVTGKYQEYDKDFIFATIQTLSKEENLQRYEKTAFDAIVIDEAHHSAANSYKKVLDYFEPKLWLGMTATPDKRDDNLEGRNIYEIFNHQIAYEIRLQDAMEEDLLCPFHYFGITDLDIIADAGKSSEEKVENFRYLTSEERVENVMKQAEYFGYSGDRVKGLIFCSRIDEAKELSKKFNDKGWRTLVLSGSDSEEARAAAIERLAGEESEDALEYIISVDIFSEGVDVPEINQVIMLRPTESPIVFIQQLGRGLRKAENKEYVVVLDFIGNYRNNFMIPIALSGDRSYNKDNIRRYVTEGGRVIPGASTIHFDEISRKRIFQAIDNANFSDIKLIRENYTRVTLMSLDQEELNRYVELLKRGKQRLATLDNESIYELMSIKRGEKVTLSATLLFSPYPQAYFPQLCITAIVIPGRTIGSLGDMGERFSDNQRIEGTIPEMLDEALLFVKRNMRTKTIISPTTGRRTDRTDYPITAVREAIINALVHRDYSIHTEGMPIQLIMFEDRIEIHNPGGLYGRITIDQLGKIQPDTRNPVLASVLETLGITENRYSGIPTIRMEMEKYNLRQPEFLDERGSFIVKLYKESKNDYEDMSNDEETNNLIVFCKTPRTRKEICDYLGLNSVTYAIQTYVNPLVEAGVIKLNIPDKPKSPKQLYYSGEREK